MQYDQSGCGARIVGQFSLFARLNQPRNEHRRSEQLPTHSAVIYADPFTGLDLIPLHPTPLDLSSLIVRKANMDSTGSIDSRQNAQRPPIWWSNAIPFVAIHLIALSGFIYRPSDWRPYLLCYINWQIATLGITLGYHRLYSHRSFTAAAPLRFILALMGTLGFQGSIKVWSTPF